LANNDEMDGVPTPHRRGRPPGRLQAEDKQRKYRGERKFSVNEIKEALQQNYGNCYMAANALNEAERQRGGTRTIDRRAVAYHVRKRPELNFVASEGRDEICDIAEQTIFQAIRDGNIALAIRYLEAQGKHRGYSRHEDAAAALLKLDRSKLTIEQIVALCDCNKLTTEQVDAVLFQWSPMLVKLDRSRLTIEQALALCDPTRLTLEQFGVLCDKFIKVDEEIARGRGHMLLSLTQPPVLFPDPPDPAPREDDPRHRRRRGA
jgi:hypothetical protein